MRASYFMPALALMFLVSACGSSKEDNQVTETRMDNLDSLEGTISDDMINTDESTDEAPVEAAPVDTGASKATAPKADADKQAEPDKSAADNAKPAETSESK